MEAPLTMPNSAQLETFTAGVETAVDVAQIERQLHELWQLAAESEKGPDCNARSRGPACLTSSCSRKPMRRPRTPVR